MKAFSFAEATGWLLAIGILVPSSGFSPGIISSYPSATRTRTSAISSSVQVDDDTDVEHQASSADDAVVRSPMRFLGPYPTMPLRFPNLATSSQRERNVTGISLDWVLDTAANVNTINAEVANELQLEKVGEAPGGVGAAGGIVGGDTFMLGDCMLDIGVVPMQNGDNSGDEDDSGKNEDAEEFVFMKELTASALPVASPAAAGLLGLAFFYCFEGGVEFSWGNTANSGAGQNEALPPAVTFYATEKNLDLGGLTRVPFESLPVSMLPSVTLRINGVEIPALFDTGSPITVLNARAAKAAGIETSIPLDDIDPDDSEKSGDGGGWNPFSKLTKNIAKAQELAKAAAQGDMLTIAGTAGTPVRLVRSKSVESVNVKTASDQEQYTTIGESQVYVGDLPGLAALGGLGGEAPPAAVLGMDVLRCRPRVVFRARQNEIYL